MDEAFELLTLMQTGKSPLNPVVLLDPPGSTYWDRWIDFVRLELLDGGLISENDLSLVHVCKDPEVAADQLCHFYSSYHSMRYVRDRIFRDRSPRLPSLTDRTLLLPVPDSLGQVILQA